MKGIILAGGSGTRLYPATKGVVKQLIPIFDKPMIYYPMSILMLAGIREILIISTPRDISRFEEIFGKGEGLGIRIEYAVQEKPRGLADAFIVGRYFIGNSQVCMVLGDNMLYGEGLIELLNRSVEKVKRENEAVIFGYYVDDPKGYGVVEFDKNKNVVSIEEKPEKPKSNFAIIGLYFYPNEVVNIANNIKPSKRGELEITSINQEFLLKKRLSVELMGRGYAWLDAGTHENLLEAGNFISVIERRQGLKIACLEEIAYKMGFIEKKQLEKLTNELGKTPYGQYLRKVQFT